MDQRLVPLSALQHYAFCPRQCALIHNERAWADNRLTAQGNILHERVDRGDTARRNGVRYERGVLINAPALGLTGKMDLLEVEVGVGRYTPVEYKRGRPKIDNCDRVQLCAQAMCLEEMLGIEVEYGALWYWQTRHRQQVPLDNALRDETLEVIASVKRLFESAGLPKTVAIKKHCQSCSLQDLCQPDLIRRDTSKSYCDDIFQI